MYVAAFSWICFATKHFALCNVLSQYFVLNKNLLDRLEGEGARMSKTEVYWGCVWVPEIARSRSLRKLSFKVYLQIFKNINWILYLIFTKGATKQNRIYCYWWATISFPSITHYPLPADPLEFHAIRLFICSGGGVNEWMNECVSEWVCVWVYKGYPLVDLTTFMHSNCLHIRQ